MRAGGHVGGAPELAWLSASAAQRLDERRRLTAHLQPHQPVVTRVRHDQLSHAAGAAAGRGQRAEAPGLLELAELAAARADGAHERQVGCSKLDDAMVVRVCDKERVAEQGARLRVLELGLVLALA